MDTESRKAALAGVFNRSASTYDRVGPRFFSYFGKRLVELAPLDEGATVLDLAAGRGAVLFPAAEKVGSTGSVTGIDLAEGMVRETQAEIEARQLTNTAILRMDAEQLVFPDAHFDAVLCGFALFFFPQLSQALAEIRRVLKPGGVLVCSTFSDRDDQRWKWLETLPRPRNRGNSTPSSTETRPRFDTPEGMQQILSQGGFESIQTYTQEVDLPYDSEDDWWATIWSHGWRETLEKFEPDELEQFRQVAYTHLQAMKEPDGIHSVTSVLITIAQKPVH